MRSHGRLLGDDALGNMRCRQLTKANIAPPRGTCNSKRAVVNTKYMTTRVYLSNVVPRIWPVEKQEATLAAGVPSWPDVTIYRDQLGPKARKAHSPDALEERAQMLRRTARRGSGEVIYVASLAVLAWSAEDFMTALAGVVDRGATVVALDTGRRIEPTAGPAQLGEALSEFLAARRRDQTGNARQAAALVQAERRKADSEARVALIREDWGNPVFSTAELLARAGKKRGRVAVPMSYRTAILYLGKRPVVLAQKEAARKRAATWKEKRNG